MRDRKKDEKVLAVFAFILAVLVVWLWASSMAPNGCEGFAYAGEPSGAAFELSDEAPYKEVDTAIQWLTRNVPRHPVQLRPKWRAKLSAYIVEAARENDLPPLLLTAVVFCESSFRPRPIATPNRPTVGLTQVHGVAAKGCDLETPEGQLLCGAKWLRYCIDDCEGSITGGLSSYANGGECWPPLKSKSIWQTGRRIRMWKLLEGIATDEGDL